MKRHQGFTLIELLITVVIAGILAAVTLPNLAPLKSKQDLNQGVALVEDAFRQAQERALSKGITVHLQFDLENNNYWLCETESGGCTVEQRISLPSLPEGVYLIDTDFVNAEQRDRNGELALDDEVAFNFEGKVVDGADVLGHVVVGHRGYPFPPYEIYLASLGGTTWTLPTPPVPADEKK